VAGPGSGRCLPPFPPPGANWAKMLVEVHNFAAYKGLGVVPCMSKEVAVVFAPCISREVAEAPPPSPSTCKQKKRTLPCDQTTLWFAGTRKHQRLGDPSHRQDAKTSIRSGPHSILPSASGWMGWPPDQADGSRLASA